MKRVAVLISGGGSNMLALLHDMVGDHPCRPVLVASNDPLAGGLAKAQAQGVPVVSVDHRGVSRADFETSLLEPLLASAPDIVCLAGFMRVLTPAFVARFEGRMLNIHPSLLPKYPGLHTHARAIAAGDAEAGASVHLVTPELDGGPVLGQARVPVHADDDVTRLAARVLVAEHALYPAVLRRFASGEKGRLDLSLNP